MDKTGFPIDCFDLFDSFPHLFVLYLRQIPVRVFVFFLYQAVCDPAFDFTLDHSHFLLSCENDVIF